MFFVQNSSLLIHNSFRVRYDIGQMADNVEDPNEKQPLEAKTQEEQIKALRTFESDALEAMRRQRIGTVDIATAEQMRPREPEVVAQTIIPEPEPEHEGRNRLLLIISGIVVLSGIITAGAYLLFRPKALPPAPVTITGKPVIAIDVYKNIDLTKFTQKDAVDAIVRERDAATLRVNSTEAITFSVRENEIARALSAGEFLSKISPSLPSAFARSLERNFVFGLMGYDGNQPFVVLRTNSYEIAYDGLLRGEVDFYREAGRAFVEGNGPLPRLSTSTIAYLGTDVDKQVFRDKVVLNIDARVVANQNDKTIFMYAFVDQATIVITTSEKTFAELVNKLRLAKLIK